MKRKDYYGLGHQFLHLVRESISEMIEEGNRTMIFSDCKEGESLKELVKKYESQTRWNDFNIGVPLLFNFYHGIELIMKGIFQGMGNKIKETHNIQELFKEISKDSRVPKRLLDILKKYLFKDNPFHEFFTTNKIQTNNYHLLLKYPESKKNEEHRFGEVRGKEEEGLERFKTLREDIIELRNEIAKYQSTLGDNI